MTAVSAPPGLYVRSLLCAGCGLGEGQVAPVHAKWSVAPLSSIKHDGFGTLLLQDASGALGASWVSPTVAILAQAVWGLALGNQSGPSQDHRQPVFALPTASLARHPHLRVQESTPLHAAQLFGPVAFCIAKSQQTLVSLLATLPCLHVGASLRTIAAIPMTYRNIECP